MPLKISSQLSRIEYPSPSRTKAPGLSWGEILWVVKKVWVINKILLYHFFFCSIIHLQPDRLIA